MADDPQVGPEEAIQVGADEATQDVSTFEALGLAEGLCKACAAMGYTTPTPIQARTIPTALEGRDVIGLAKTGAPLKDPLFHVTAEYTWFGLCTVCR